MPCESRCGGSQGQCVPGQFRDGSSKLDAGRAGTDDRESQERRLKSRIGFQLCALEGRQNAAPDRCSILDPLQAGHKWFPFTVAKISMAGSSGKNESVVRLGIAAIQLSATRTRIHADQRSKQSPDFWATAEKGSNRPSDL
jgi:hypothetical protein